MKSRAILGYAVILSFAIFFTKECKCEIVQNPQATNATAAVNPGASINEDDDNFQGARDSIFDWLLFKSIARSYSGNVLISPISVKLALMLLYEGAQEQTANELASVMHLPASRLDTREKFATILRSLQTPSTAYTLDIGTRLYIDTNIMTRQQYESIVQYFYKTDLIKTNLSDVHSVAESINSWVNSITHGSISKMIENENSISDSVMLIMNALFFKGAWRYKYFAPQNTRVEKFYTGTGETVDVPFMHTTKRLYYFESSELKAKILRIPYDGDKFAMYFVLPISADGIDRVLRDINPITLKRHVWRMQDLQVDVSIPKFKFDFSSQLESVLRELGIRDIFDNTAMLTGIAHAKRTSHLKVSDIIQKTGIEVNEDGTTAYAATEVLIGNKIDDVSFNANHSFVFYIEDETTGAILHAGKVSNPLLGTGSVQNSPVDLASRFGGETWNSVLAAFVPSAEDRYNFFNIDLLQAINEELEGNVVVSPASAKLALTVLAEATAGRTRQELLSALRLPDERSKIREIARGNVVALKRSDSGTEVDSATCLWVPEDLRVPANYINSLQRYYGGDVQHVNFPDQMNVANSINDWVRRTTRNKITSLTDFGSISADTRLLLTSALYFKGRWLKSFNKSSTTLRCFEGPNTGCQRIPFMENTSMYRYAYIPSLDADVTEIPYTDGKTSMLIILPRNRDNDHKLRILTKDLSYVSVSALLGNLQRTELLLSIPKFSIESKLDLRSILPQLGIRDIFGASANLTGLAAGNSLRVGSVLQSAKIEVDEEGTVAAAVTAVGIIPLMGTSMHIFRANHPFIFLIVDLQTHTTLFSGRIMQPTLNDIPNMR